MDSISLMLCWLLCQWSECRRLKPACAHTVSLCPHGQPVPTRSACEAWPCPPPLGPSHPSLLWLFKHTRCLLGLLAPSNASSSSSGPVSPSPHLSSNNTSSEMTSMTPFITDRFPYPPLFTIFYPLTLRCTDITRLTSHYDITLMTSVITKVTTDIKFTTHVFSLKTIFG